MSSADVAARVGTRGCSAWPLLAHGELAAARLLGAQLRLDPDAELGKGAQLLGGCCSVRHGRTSVQACVWLPNFDLDEASLGFGVTRPSCCCGGNEVMLISAPLVGLKERNVGRGESLRTFVQLLFSSGSIQPVPAPVGMDPSGNEQNTTHH